MALRRRAQQNDTAHAAQDRRSKHGGHAPSDEDDDESASGFNMLSICLQYADITQRKDKAKVEKAMAEARKIASDYADDIQAVILKEQHDIQAAYEEYRSESQKDAVEKEEILVKLLQNFEDTERLARTLQDRSVKFETRRYDKTKKDINDADTQRAASANRVNVALNNKREAVLARTESVTLSKRG